MKRHFPGLHAEASRGDGVLEGIFLVRRRVRSNWMRGATCFRLEPSFMRCPPDGCLFVGIAPQQFSKPS
jgi:hypothetical protein